MCLEVANPLASVNVLIGLAIVSLAILTNPYTMSSISISLPVSALICFRSASNKVSEAEGSMGSSSFGPKH